MTCNDTRIPTDGPIDDHCSPAPGCHSLAWHRRAAARRAVRTFRADHPAPGGERGHHPGQCRLAGETDRRAWYGRRRGDQRGRHQQRRRPRGAIEGWIRFAEGADVISTVAQQLWCVAALLATTVLAIATSRSRRSTAVVYGATFAI